MSNPHILQFLKETLTHIGVMTWQGWVKPKEIDDLITMLSRNRAAIVKGATDLAGRKRDTTDVVESLMRRVGNESDASLHRTAA